MKKLLIMLAICIISISLVSCGDLVDIDSTTTEASEMAEQTTHPENDDISQPTFLLGEDTIQHGEFVVITAANIDDISKIKFTSEPTIDYTPVFYKDGSNAIALVPISIDLEYSPSYKFKLTYNEVEKQLDLTVTNRIINNQYASTTTDETESKISEEILSSFDE